MAMEMVHGELNGVSQGRKEGEIEICVWRDRPGWRSSINIHIKMET